MNTPMAEAWDRAVPGDRLAHAAAALDPGERATCSAMARLLQADAVLALWGLAGSALAAAMLLLPPAIGSAAAAAGWLVAALGAGLAERYLALRLRLDAGLFADLGGGRIGSLYALDAALAGTSLRAAPLHTRPLDQRIAGAGRLLRWHVATLVLQALALVAARLG